MFYILKIKKNGLSRFYAKDDFKEKLQKVSEFHCISHLGRDKMEIGLKNRIYGVSREEIMAVLSSCKTCQVKKLLTTKPIIKPIIHKNPRDRYLADMIDLRHYASVNNGFAWILVIIDSYSKYIYCVPCYRKEAIEVSQALVKMFRILGPPLIFHTDNGKEFKNQLVSDVCNLELSKYRAELDVLGFKARWKEQTRQSKACYHRLFMTSQHLTFGSQN